MKIFSFNGRSHRLALLGINIATSVLLFGPFLVYASMTGELSSSGSTADSGPLASIFGIVLLILLVPGIWISLAVAVRRMHDLGWSGWWYLLSFLPLVSLVQGIWLLVVPGQEGDNRFGPSPVSGTTDVAQTFS